MIYSEEQASWLVAAAEAGPLNDSVFNTITLVNDNIDDVMNLAKKLCINKDEGSEFIKICARLTPLQLKCLGANPSSELTLFKTFKEDLIKVADTNALTWEQMQVTSLINLQKDVRQHQAS